MQTNAEEMSIKMINKQLFNLENNKVASEYPEGKKNWGKRIVIRKIAREVDVEYVYDDQGNPINFLEWEFHNKYIKYK